MWLCFYGLWLPALQASGMGRWASPGRVAGLHSARGPVGSWLVKAFRWNDLSKHRRSLFARQLAVKGVEDKRRNLV